MTKPESAAELIGAVRRAGDQLMAALFRLKANTPKDFEHWKVPVGRVMGELYDRLLEPLFKEHPDLTPPEIGGPPTKAKKVRRRPTKSK